MTSGLPSLFVLLATLSPAASGEDILPGRDGRYQLSGAVQVEGTMWRGQTKLGEHFEIFIVRFERGGVLGYTSSSGTYPDGGNWKQNGNAIYLEINGKYSEYRGVLCGDRITGKATNKDGLQWKWDVKWAGPIGKD